MSSGRNIVRTGLRLGICALLLLWILHSIFVDEGRLIWQRQGHSWETLSRGEQWKIGWSYGPGELWHTLIQVTASGLFLSIVCAGLAIVLGALRWFMVLRAAGLDLQWNRAMEISFVAHFFNSFLLGSTGGDLLKAYYAARETRHKKIEAVVTVYVDRLIGLFSMLLFAGMMIPPNSGLLFSQGRLAAVTWLVLAMLLGCAIVAGMSFWGGISRRWPKARDWFRRLSQGEILERSLEACRQFGRKPVFLARVVVFSMLLNGVCVLQMWVLSQGMHLQISPLALLVIVPMIICISALPVTPSGLGVRENLYVLMLAAPGIGIGSTQALSLSLLAYACSLFWSLIGAGVYISVKETHHLVEVTASDQVTAG